MSFKRICGLAFALITITSIVHGQDSAECIAYLHNHEIRVRCGNTERSLLRRPGLSMYAINSPFIAIVLTRTVTRNRDEQLQTDKVLLLSGSKEKVVTVPAPIAFLYASCGTILANLRDARETTWDIIAGRPAAFTSLRRPVCSADRSDIVGINSSGQLVDSSGTVIAQPREFGHYAISRSGTMIGIFRQPKDRPLKPCIRSGSTERCYDAEVVDGDGISVDDNGRALFVQLIGQTCYYVNGELTTHKLAGAVPDQCFASMLATPKSPPKSVAVLGNLPSWLSGVAAMDPKLKQ